MNDEQEWQRVQAHLRLNQATPEALRNVLGGISQPSLSRRVQRWRPALRQLGRGPATHYALARSVGAYSEFPVFRISTAGECQRIGVLLPCYPGDAFWFESEIDGETSRGFDDLPWWLADMRPNGFLGRLFVEQCHAALGLPRDPRSWDSNHVLTALAQAGDNTTGDLIVGEVALNRWLAVGAGREPPVRESGRAGAYVALVARHQELVFGSSAAGEQPKFGAELVDDDGRVRHVLVKYSAADDSAGASRWRDLLRAERLALQSLAELGVPVPAVQLLEADGRVFLESERFDRVGARGRRAAFSLGSVDDEFYGQRHTDWLAAGRRLFADQRVSADDYRHVRMQAVFGALIGNTDQHYGNLTLLPVGPELSGRRFQLAPAYDCLPMLFKPTETNEIVERELTIAPPSADTLDEWPVARAAAVRYWQQVADCSDFSALFRRLAQRNAQRLAAA